MKFSENWLREFVPVPADPTLLERRLNLIGHEVESVRVLGADLAGVVVAEILSCEKHPRADRLRVCRVTAGGAAPLSIVCGAPNARVGLKAPLATVGTALGSTRIEKTTLRGIESEGMLCSASELGLDEDANGLLELPADAPVGRPLAEYLGLPDRVFELALTPNRADCLSLAGLAVDVAAAFGAAARAPVIASVPARGSRRFAAEIEAGADCPRYCGRVIENVDPRMPTPLWMSERLRRCGIRPVSLLVDVTQYVMLELGQPMHAYDLARLAGPIRVRRARSGERVKLLDGHEYTLDEDFLVIADAHELHGLAGIMGGFASRVTEATRAVFLEAAHFAPEAIQGRARRLGLHTEAAHRFERGVDPQAPRRALERATQLLLELAGGIAGPVCETVCEEFLPQRLPVSLRRARLRRVLGIDVPDHEVERILAALEMWIERTPEGWRVTPPSRRFDVAIEEDLIEEVARIHGYDAVPCHPPRGELRLPPLPEAGVPLARLRAHLAARGYQEAICYSFVAADLLGRWSLDAGAVPLANPLSADLAVMRTSLLPGLVEALKRNHNRQQERVRLFETGLVFIGSDGLQQVPRLAAVASGRAAPESWATDKRLVDFFDLKADVESLLALGGDRRQVEFTPSREPWLHPGRSARISIDGEPVGVLGELHPRLQKILDLNVAVQVFELALAAVTAGRVPQARLPSRFPAVRRDLALVVADDLPYAAIERSVRAVLGNCLAELRVFDEYHDPNLGVGTKSLAIGLILQDDSRTLTDQDADRCVAQAIEALERECHAKLRGKQ